MTLITLIITDQNRAKAKGKGPYTAANYQEPNTKYHKPKANPAIL